MEKSCPNRIRPGRFRLSGLTGPSMPDPVIEQRQNEDCFSDMKTTCCKEKEKHDCIKPSLSKRLALAIDDRCKCPGAKYVPPKSTKKLKKALRRRRKYVKDLNFCDHKEVAVSKPPRSTKLDVKLKAPSAQIKKACVLPRKPSASPCEFPDPIKCLDPEVLKSGAVINEIVKTTKIKKRIEEEDEPPPCPCPCSCTVEEMIIRELEIIQEVAEDGEWGDDTPLVEPMTKRLRRKVSQISKTTSYQTKDIKLPEEESEPEEDHMINAIAQKFRRDSEIARFKKPRRKTKKGTFENFSFTKFKQPTLKAFYYGVKLGTIHQSDQHFPVKSRGRQGLCMPIAAYCFSILKHPNKWSTCDIDDVLEAGNELFLESAESQHLHGDDVEIDVFKLRKYCKLGKKKVRFVVSEPEISGMVRSNNSKIYNLTKALNIFFAKNSAGILHTKVLSVAIWRDKHYYFFDAGPRTIDLFTHENGTALMANFYDTTSVVTVLLKHSALENLPFIIYSIKAYKILPRDAEEVDSTGVIPEMDNFQVISEEKAVASASFDLGDKCFGYSRNKQAITIAVIALVYSKITPSSSWHKGTVDKIIIIGNQLFLECIENDIIEEVKIEDVPAVFIIGPYVVEVYIAPNCFGGFMFKTGTCVLQERLQKFFETNSNAIVEIDSFALAVWKQRNVYHCLDPYSRSREGLKCRHGTACVSMHTSLESLMEMVVTNFDDKKAIFRVHAMKVCKIHRDPSTKGLFPKCLTMNDFPVENFKKLKMKKGRKKAVSIYYDTRATNFYEDFPEKSIMEVDSTVESVGMEGLPPMIRTSTKPFVPRIAPPDDELVVDLDSPSLSDTQIEPPPPEQPPGDSAIDFMDLDSFQLTQEELEMHKRGEGKEGEGATKRKRKMSGEDEEGEGSDQWYMAATGFTQVGPRSFISRQSQEVNTDDFVVEIPEEEVPMLVRNIPAIIQHRKNKDVTDYLEMVQEPEVTIYEELAKETNFLDLPDGSQIVLGGTNIAAFAGDVEIMAPFVCIMAAAVAKKYSIESWSKDVVDYVLESGSKLYSTSNTRYDQNYNLEIPKISLGKTDFSIRVNYLFDSSMEAPVLEKAISTMLFPQCSSGIVVTPTYTCAIFYKNHLYYLYDAFANNEVGLSKGICKEGIACLLRFQSINLLVMRLLHNKAKREEESNVEYNRFVLSSCCVQKLGVEKPPRDEEAVCEKKTPKEPPPSKIGYRIVDGLWKIQGTTCVPGEKTVCDNLKQDYFVCLCACLMVLITPLKKWDDRRIDAVLEQGLQVYNHVEDIAVCSKKIIKNILIDNYFFDISAKRVPFFTYSQRRTLRGGIETMLAKKHEHFILQFPNRSFALSVDDDVFHLFDPNDSGKASWTMYCDFQKLVRRLKRDLIKGLECYNFHCFKVMSIKKAPKHVIIGNRAKNYKVLKEKKAEMWCEPFNEDVDWLQVNPLPWSWFTEKTDFPTWNHWFVIFPDDLFSLFGMMTPFEDNFSVELQGKETLAFLVVAIGMLQIYKLADWTATVMDNILQFGDNFFRDCIKDIKTENYEFLLEDVNKECYIFPYTFQVLVKNITTGTMFLCHHEKFNLYKALRFFFGDCETRYGIISVSKEDKKLKKLYAFGKTQESEYFFYDCETLGSPMFVTQGVPYVLRATSLNRLVYVMALTLRGGNFFIFDVTLTCLKVVNWLEDCNNSK